VPDRPGNLKTDDRRVRMEGGRPKRRHGMIGEAVIPKAMEGSSSSDHLVRRCNFVTKVNS
jgi:hypothetical protein